MAQYKHLPIYKTTYELLEAVTRKTRHFPRDFKYSLGDKIRNECVELVVFIYKANSTRDKAEFLTQILERVQVIELLMRLASCWTERRQFSNYLTGRGYRLDRPLTKLIQGPRPCISA